MPTRVHELAKEVDMPSKELVGHLHEMGFEVKSHMSVMTDQEVEDFRSDWEAHVADAMPERAAKMAKAKADAGEADEDEPAEAPDAASDDETTAAADEAPVESETPADADAETAATEVPTAEGDDAEVPVAEGEDAPAEGEEPEEEVDAENLLVLKGVVLVKDLAEMIGLKPNQLIAELMGMNIFASINQKIEFDIARQLGEKHGFTVESEKERKKKEEAARKPPPAPAAPKAKKKKRKPGDAKEIKPGEAPRPPVVTFLGHVDHGKTSLLDRIRNARVAKGEAGGITQHVGAYTIEHNGHKITFLDTPGHAAFTKMRARGANITDIAVLVIAADSGIMPQTREAMQHAQAAEVLLMVALNKIDLPTADVDRVKQQLQQENLTPEDWGGDVITVPVSAQTGQGIDELMEYINLQAEILELTADPSKPAKGRVIEAQVEKGMGPTATVLVQEGTLNVGDAITCGPYWGKIKALISDTGARVKTAGPSYAVKILGLTDAPMAGEEFQVISDDKEAKSISDDRLEVKRQTDLEGPDRGASLDTLLGLGKVELPLVIKSDVQGTSEAIVQALADIPSEKVQIKHLLTGVGSITENDVLLASASQAIIVGFNVKVEAEAARMAKRERVEIRTYKVIYELIDEIVAAMEGLLAPEAKETVTGHAEVRAIFQLNKKGSVAGCMLTDGKVTQKSKVRVRRGRDYVFTGEVLSLRRFQDEAKEVREGQECGIRLKGFDTVKEGDVIEAFEVEHVTQSL